MKKNESNKTDISVSNENNLNMKFCENYKIDQLQKQFFSNEHISQVMKMIVEEMSTYFPNLNNYLNNFDVYNTINSHKKEKAKKKIFSLNRNKLNNIIYDGMVMKEQTKK